MQMLHHQSIPRGVTVGGNAAVRMNMRLKDGSYLTCRDKEDQGEHNLQTGGSLVLHW